MTPENKVKKDVENVLKKYQYVEIPPPYDFVRLVQERIIWWYKPQAGIHGRSGIPDFIGCIAGKFFGIECKSQKGYMTPLQNLAMGGIIEAGGKVFLVKPHKDGTNTGLKELEDWLYKEVCAHNARIKLGISPPT